VKIPDALKSDVAAPLLCAGITVYSPMMRHGLGDQPGKKVGVIALGGVGHMAVKIAKALGHHVTVFSTSTSKKEEALGVLGADDFLVSTDEAAMKAEADSFDFIIDTAPANIPLDPYIILLKQKGVFVIVGSASELKFNPHLLFRRKVITGSAAGGMEEMQEMLNFCAEKGVEAMVEVVSMEKVNEVFERLLKNDVRYRFVVDVGNAF
jgi:cinnamyl-alcohol dehydrogenase